MRRIHTFQYYNKTFKAWDLTVWDYWLYLQSPSDGLLKILSEYNQKMPRMNADHLVKFQDIIFGTDNEEKMKAIIGKKGGKSAKKIAQDIKNTELDFHVEIGTFCLLLHQPYDSVLAMPLWVYNRMWQDMKYITGKEQMPKDRHNKTIDGEWLKKALKTQ